MDDLNLHEHRQFIEALVASHVDGRVEIVPSKEEIGGVLGRALWGSRTERPLIQLAAYITSSEISNSLLALAIRGHIKGHEVLEQHASEITTSEAYLQHLVLHEVAHIKNNWTEDRETDCDLWVYDQLHGET